MTDDTLPHVHQVAVVIPVYQGEHTLDAVVSEIRELAEPTPTPGGRVLQVVEILLVHDNGPDDSAGVIRRLARRVPTVRAVWLSRNFGQHAATLAGLASSSSEWVATMDEDGQHDPRDLLTMLDAALDDQVPLVYAVPDNVAPHGVLRNTASAFSRWLAQTFLTDTAIGRYNSFRLVTGELGRAVAAYGGQDIYLDIALSWVVPGSTTARTHRRVGSDRPSGYTLPKLLNHFLRLIVTSGTRPLRAVAALGVTSSLVGAVLAVVFAYRRAIQDIQVPGWTFLMVTVLGFSGMILIVLGVMAEYIGVGVRMALGRPPYLIVGDPMNGPLRHSDRAGSAPDVPVVPREPDSSTR